MAAWVRAGRKSRSVAFSAYSWIPKAAKESAGHRIFPRLLRLLGLLSLVPVMAGIGSRLTAQVSRSFPPALIIVLDVSSSMTAEDFKPVNRLEEAKKDLKSFLAGNPQTEIGLIVFAAAPRLVVPLTSDHAAILRALESVAPAGYGEDGTAIGSGIASALNRLRDGSWARRSVVLITDGVNNRGALSPADAARLARELGIAIHAVGIGTDELSRYFVPSAAGTPIEVHARIEIDDEALAGLALETRGSYRRVRDSDGLHRALLSLDLGASRQEKVGTPDHDTRWARILAWAALLLLCAEFVLVRFVFWELPG